MKKMLLLLVCLTTFAWLHAEDVTVTLDLTNPALLSPEGETWTNPTANNALYPTDFGKDGVSVAVDFNNTATNSKLRFFNNGSSIMWRCSASGGKNNQKFTISAPGNIKKIIFTISSSKFAVSAAPTGLNSDTWTGDAESVTFTTTGENRLTAIAVTYAKADETKVAVPTFSPVAGNVAKGTEVSIDCETEGATIHYTTDGTDPDANSTVYTGPIVIDKAMTIKAIAVKEGMSTSDIVEATYKIIVATPTFDPAPGAVAKGTAVRILCGTEGATLMYQVNGGELLEGESGVIVVINEATTIEVIASKDGYVDSEAIAKYTIIGEIETAPKAFFNFTDPTSLGLKAESDTPISGQEIIDNGVTVVCTKVGNNEARIWNKDGFHVRVYSGATVTISAGEGQSIESVQFKGGSLNNLKYNGQALYKADANVYNWWQDAYQSQRATSNTVTFNVEGGRVDINSINVNDPVVTGVEDVTVDENAPVEYYNLQGVRVANPENGIYIRRQGSKVSKVLVK